MSKKTSKRPNVDGPPNHGPESLGADSGRKTRSSARAKLIAISCLLLPLAACIARHEQAPATRVVVDELGRSVRVQAVPSRIVSLAPSITETLFALGLESRIVGVTSFCDYPPEAASIEKVGDTQRPSLEKIVALKPDLVIIVTASQLEQFVKRLDDLAIPVYVSNPGNIDSVLESIDRLGELTATADRARELSSSLRARIESVRARVTPRPRPRVLLILGNEPLITVGGTSFINDLIVRAGGYSISSDELNDYPQYSLESAVAKQPEVIFLQSGERDLPARLKQTPAAREGRVYQLDSDLLLRPGPRIVDGLEQMASKIHP
ncbi:MAG TPA: cobalamin-binding protein [Blastocatellia bacterium]|nr:cobalamin-binding protein [Blastocatellia bacterium]